MISDGRDNFISSLILAGHYTIPEVAVFFNHKLFRGNRVTKTSADNFNAFDSHNMIPLATVGVAIEGKLLWFSLESTHNIANKY